MVQMSTWNAQIGRSGRTKRCALALRAALAERADIYHFHDPELIPLGLILKVLRPSAAVVYDVHEDYPAMMRVKYWIPERLRPLRAQAAHLANTAAGVCLDGAGCHAAGYSHPGQEQVAKEWNNDRQIDSLISLCEQICHRYRHVLPIFDLLILASFVYSY